MKYKITKAGRYAKSPRGPIVTFEKNQIVEASELGNYLVDLMLYAEEPCCEPIVSAEELNVVEETDDKEVVDLSHLDGVDVPSKILEICDAAENKTAAKDALEKWSRANLDGFEVDKRKSLDNIKLAVMEEYERLTA